LDSEKRPPLGPPGVDHNARSICGSNWRSFTKFSQADGENGRCRELGGSRT
jgi:hypothetical protein